MLWFYVSSLAVLVGAGLNSEIEHASPEGKAPGEKQMGTNEPAANDRGLRSLKPVHEKGH